mgnify:CR=1 FL=1
MLIICPQSHNENLKIHPKNKESKPKKLKQYIKYYEN